MSSFRWSEFQKRIDDADPDFRIIALNDLQTDIATKDSLSEEPQSMIMAALLHLFGPKEPNNEVHSTAIGVLPYVYRLLSPVNRKVLVDVLARYMNPTDKDFAETEDFYRKGSMREGAAMGLRQLAPCFDRVKDISVANALVVSLVGTLASVKQKEERSDVYDILSKTLPFTQIQKDAIALYDTLYTQIRGDLGNSGDEFVFSKTCQTLCSLAPFLSADQFGRMVKDLTNDLSTSSGTKLRHSIDVITALSKNVADRLAPDMPALFDILFREISRLDGLTAEERESDASDEVRAGALEAIANLLGDASPSAELLARSLTVAAALVSWDPNFCGDVEVVAEEEEGGFTGFGDDDDEEGGFDYNDSGYMDEPTMVDDGCSWKVRRAAYKVLLASVLSRRDLLQSVILPILTKPGSGNKPLLVASLKDRSQDNIPFSLGLVATVLQLCNAQSQGAPVSDRSVASLESMAPLVIGEICAIVTKGTHSSPALECLRTAIRTLGVAGVAGDAIAAAKSILDVPQGTGDAKALGAAMEVVSTIVATGNGAAELLPAVVAHTAVYRYQVTKDAIATLEAVLPYVAAQPALVSSVLKGGVAAMTSAGMDGMCRRAGAQLCAAIVGCPNQSALCTSALEPIIEALTSSLQVDDLRVSSANTIAAIFVKQPQLASGVNAAKIGACAVELSTHLRKQLIDEREAAAMALVSILEAAPAAVPSSATDKVLFDLQNSSSMMSVSDVRMNICAFNLIAALAALPQVVGKLIPNLVAHSLTILEKSVYTSTLHQASARAFGALARTAPSFDALVSILQSSVAAIPPTTDGRANMAAVALGAAVGADTDVKRRTASIKGLLDKMASADSGAQAATALGEVGRHIDLAETAPTVLTALLKEVQVTDTVKVAATRALGFACSGDIGKKTLETVLDHLKSPKATGALSGVLLRSMSVALALTHKVASVDALVSALLAPSSAHPELAGECLGRLASWNLGAVVSALHANLAKSSESFSAALVVMAAAKGIVSNDGVADTTQTIEALSGIVVAAGKAYSTSKDALSLRRHTINAMESLVNRRGGRFYTQAMNAVLLPCLIGELIEDAALVNVIDLNTFKQKEDRGADLRREAFLTLEALVVREGASFTDGSVGGILCPLIGVTEEQRKDVAGRVINACAPRDLKAKTYTSPYPVEDVTEVNFVARRVLLLTGRTPGWTEVLRTEVNNIGASLKQLAGGNPEKPPQALPEAEKSRYRDNIDDARKTLRELRDIFPRAASSTAAPQFVEAVRLAIE